MSLLQKIQESVVEENSNLGSILLQLRLLAARLGSDILEEWVKYESEGYPTDVDVPSYRVVQVTYRGTFLGPFGSEIRNARIPPYLIEKYAGENWIKYEIRESIGAIDEIIKKNSDGRLLGIDASNLILLLQGKIYERYACNDVSGQISSTSFYEIQQAVRSKILELTLELERSVPVAMHVSFGKSITNNTEAEKVQKISQQIFYGNVSAAIADANIAVKIVEKNRDSFVSYLVKMGIPEVDASELAEIMETEEPTSSDEPFGKEAKDWIAANLKNAAKGTWSIGVSLAKRVLTEAALKYYGFK